MTTKEIAFSMTGSSKIGARLVISKWRMCSIRTNSGRLESSVMKRASLFLFAALLLAACDMKPVVEKRFGKKENPERNTSVLQAADFVGYDGKKLRKSAGALIDANTKHNKAIERAVDSK